MSRHNKKAEKNRLFFFRSICDKNFFIFYTKFLDFHCLFLVIYQYLILVNQFLTLIFSILQNAAIFEFFANSPLLPASLIFFIILLPSPIRTDWFLQSITKALFSSFLAFLPLQQLYLKVQNPWSISYFYFSRLQVLLNFNEFLYSLSSLWKDLSFAPNEPS